MKNILIILLVFYTQLVHSQAPQGIPYQAVARNSSGAILASTAISVRFTIIDSVATGSIKYRETHSVTTSSQGMFSVNVGQGIPVTGTFSGINWGANAKFMQVELDPAGGSSYVDMGTQQMMSVPYALYAGSYSGQGESSLHGYWLFNNDTLIVIPNGIFELDISIMGAAGGAGGRASGPYSIFNGGAGGQAKFVFGKVKVNSGDTIRVDFGVNGVNGSDMCCGWDGYNRSGGNGTAGTPTYLYVNSVLQAIIYGGGGGGGGFACTCAYSYHGAEGAPGYYDIPVLINSKLLNIDTTNIFNLSPLNILIRY